MTTLTEDITTDLSTIDISTLSEKEQAQLYPFHHAWSRPYPPALTWRQLRAEGLTPIEHTQCGIDEIEESFDELIQWTLDEDGMVVPLKGNDRASWLDRKINAWTRRDVWSLH